METTFRQHREWEHIVADNKTVLIRFQHGLLRQVDRRYLSDWICKGLDDFGYSIERTRERVENWKRVSRALTHAAHKLKHDKIERQHVGSLGEGIALVHESDTDILQTNNSVICVENLDSSTCVYDNRIVFHLDQDRAPAGYAYLRLTDKGNNDIGYMRDIEHALEQSEDAVYISSKKYLCKNEDIFYGGRGYVCQSTTYSQVNGPSIPKKGEGAHDKFQDWLFKGALNTDTDFVQAFPCQCPSLLKAWSIRARPHDWPSREMLHTVESLPCHVVAVGKKGSLREHLQWRISLTLAEVYLVQTLNDTQRKVLIILRHIAKRYLKPLSPCITSYVIKNVVFWTAERTPLRKFQPQFLLDRVEDAILFLRSCIKKKSLKNYMIPERNLLKDKLADNERKSLLQAMSDIIERTEDVFVRLYSHENTMGNNLVFHDRIDITTNEVINLRSEEQMAMTIVRLDRWCCSSILFIIYHLVTVTLPYIWRHKRTLLKKLFCRAINQVLEDIGFVSSARLMHNSGGFYERHQFALFFLLATKIFEHNLYYMYFNFDVVLVIIFGTMFWMFYEKLRRNLFPFYIDLNRTFVFLLCCVGFPFSSVSMDLLARALFLTFVFCACSLH